MPTTFFLVRAVVVAPFAREVRPLVCDRPPAVGGQGVFKCDKAWRFWSELEPGVHYAVYRFADKAACDAALASDEFKALVADFDRAFPRASPARATC